MPTPIENLLRLLNGDMDIVMEFLSDYPVINEILTNTIPYIHQAHSHLQTLTPHLRKTYTQTLHLLNPLYHTLLKTLTPLLTTIQHFASQAPAITALIVLLAIIWYIFWIMSFIRRVMAWGTRMVFGVLFWGVLGYFVLVVWERGVVRTAGEVWGWGWWWGDVEGEYEGFEEGGRGSEGAEGFRWEGWVVISWVDWRFVGGLFVCLSLIMNEAGNGNGNGKREIKLGGILDGRKSWVGLSARGRHWI
ncbi:7ccd9eea-ef4c-4c3d-ae08-78bfb68de25b-CDS [Sclerotinia trifoliorum]|uniref:7ccd9eea-ef4c-4c3d-ae08-78bfb68de25b-CDS n=1 Tax=Sclerotinia trifoliorum TaxID=28548 RepID=A0A8H2VZ10_9HELO|nr:7ccd9eea-ef4c-4c3d-ae08-78bfb68de25b-CDS [Sclerotinia trifoliorum]